jgi:hypothetical protein
LVANNTGRASETANTTAISKYVSRGDNDLRCINFIFLLIFCFREFYEVNLA